MQSAPVPLDDAERVSALRAFSLLDSPREVVFDRITSLASELLGTSISLLSLIDEDRQWFKSRVGTDAKEGDRCSSFCGHAIMEDRVMVVRDAQRDERFNDNPWVTGNPKIRFYAGAALRTSDGHAIGTLCAIDSQPRPDFDDQQARVLRALADIAMAQIEMRQSFNRVDVETGTYSREQLLRVLRGESRRARETNRDALLAVVDIALPRQMEELTRVMGYDHAQNFVMESIARIAEVIGREQDIYRIGLFRFGFVIPRYEGPLTRNQMEALTDALRIPFSCAGVPIKPHATVGLAELQGPLDGDALETLRMASVATDSAATHRRQWAFYDPQHNVEHERRYRTLADLPAALSSRDQLSLVYQPKIDLATGTCRSVEALLRWEHPYLGNITPDEIVAAAGNTELMPQITDWVMDNALGQLSGWLRAGHTLGVAINISARDAVDPALPQRVAAALKRHDISAHLLDIEITESALVTHMEGARDQLQQLNAMGVSTSLDDFGSGYCNMHYLPQLPVQTIKLDGSFFRSLHTTQRHRTLTASLIHMARDLGFRVVAKAIADDEALAFAASHGCDAAQGFLFSAGKSPDRLLQWLQSTESSIRPMLEHPGMERAEACVALNQ